MTKFILPRKNQITQHLPHRLRAEAMPKYWGGGNPEEKIADPGGEPCPNFSSQGKTTAPDTSTTESFRKLCPNFEMRESPTEADTIYPLNKLELEHNEEAKSNPKALISRIGF